MNCLFVPQSPSARGCSGEDATTVVTVNHHFCNINHLYHYHYHFKFVLPTASHPHYTTNAHLPFHPYRNCPTPDTNHRRPSPYPRGVFHHDRPPLVALPHSREGRHQTQTLPADRIDALQQLLGRRLQEFGQDSGLWSQDYHVGCQRMQSLHRFVF